MKYQTVRRNFLETFTHIYKRVCPSVHPSVTRFPKVHKNHCFLWTTRWNLLFGHAKCAMPPARFFFSFLWVLFVCLSIAILWAVLSVPKLWLLHYDGCVDYPQIDLENHDYVTSHEFEIRMTCTCTLLWNWDFIHSTRPLGCPLNRLHTLYSQGLVTFYAILKAFWIIVLP